MAQINPQREIQRIKDFFGRANRDLVPLTWWHVVDEMTMEELQLTEDRLFALQTTLTIATRMLLQAQRKRWAQSAGGELRHQIANLRKELDDCQTIKRSLSP